MRYFAVMTGLRGCYMPDESYAAAVKTRRELKILITDEYDRCVGDEAPARRRDIASVAAALWRRRPTDRDSYLSTVMPAGEGYGVQLNPISREEYLQAERNREYE
jgi:hypothetical protein